MKKIFALIFFSLFLAACNPSNETKQTSEVSKDSPNQLYEQASKLNYFTSGNMMSLNKVYILFDPQCPHCGQLWTELKDVNNVNINWIPVAFMNNKSLGQGAYILQSSSPINAMIEHERLMDEKKGGIIAGEIKDDFKAKIETNNVFFKKNFQGVPVLLIKNKQEQFEVIPGGISKETLKGKLFN